MPDLRSASFRCLLIWQKVTILAHMRYDDDCLRHMTLRSNQSSSKLTLTMSCLQLIFCSGDEVLISLFRGDSNTDIYKQMASVIRNRPAGSITPEERAVRRVNFLIHHKLYLLAIISSCFSSVLTEFSTDSPLPAIQTSYSSSVVRHVSQSSSKETLHFQSCSSTNHERFLPSLPKSQVLDGRD